MSGATPAATPRIRRLAPYRGLAYMAAGVFCMSVIDAVAKALVGGYALPQLVFVGRLPGPFFAIALALAGGGMASLTTRRIGWHVLRSLVTVVTTVSFFACLGLLPLADAVAIAFAGPLFMCALSVPMLRERVGPRRWAAILVGFVGVAIVLQPSGTGLGLGPLLALVAALAYALSINLSRLLSDTETSQSMLFWVSVFMLAGSGALLPFCWKTPDLHDALLFALLAVAGTLGQFCVIQAFRYGEVSLLAPLEYSALIWATLFGFLFWQQLPTATVVAGAAVIMVSSLYVVHREALAARRRQIDQQGPRPRKLDAAGPPPHLPDA
jgi:drug/metabolite transporter (DMT)-like permease